MGQTGRGRRLTTREFVARQALGLTMLMLVLGAGYTVSRVDIGESTEQAVEVVADEPAASTPTEVDINNINTHIVDVATRYGVEPKLVAAIVAVESRFDARAVSRRGAEGLMQLMPATAAYLDVQDSFDPRENIDGGVRHFKRLMTRFHNDVPLALAAYNAGEQAVINHRGIPPYRETRQYVVRVLRRYDREAAQVVAQQLAKPRPSATPKIARANYVGRTTVLPPSASAESMPDLPPVPRPSHAERSRGAPPEKEPSESP
jgi:hypothetical protein